MTSRSQVSLKNWCIEDRNGRAQTLSGICISAGDTVRVTLDPTGAQLSNKGGQISVINAAGRVVHSVTYPREQARSQGETALF